MHKPFQLAVQRPMLTSAAFVADVSRDHKARRPVVRSVPAISSENYCNISGCTRHDLPCPPIAAKYDPAGRSRQIDIERQDRMPINDLGVSRRRLQSRTFFGATNLDLVRAFVGPKWQASADPSAFQRRSERWSIRVFFKAARRSIPLQIPFGDDHLSGRFVTAGNENDWNCDRRSCGKADHSPAADTNFMLPFAAGTDPCKRETRHNTENNG